MSKLLVVVFGFGVGALLAGCSAGADDGGSNAASIDAERVGARCVVGATPAITTWCGGADWSCERGSVPSNAAGQCLPTAFCLSDSDCGCRAGEACSVVCVGRCYSTCDKDRSVCEGGSRCTEEMVGSGKAVWACF